jgi:DNA gyrase subunit A
VTAEQEVILVSRKGLTFRTRVDLISQQGRSTQGVAVMNVEDEDAVASIAVIDMGTRDA